MARTDDPPLTPVPPSAPGATNRLPRGRGGRRGGAGVVAAGAAGLVAAAASLGTGELVAGLAAEMRSPVEAVASEVIDRAPRPVERFAIETFGTNDKLALVLGTLALSAVLGVVLGVVARRRPWVGAAGFAAFALLGGAAALSGPSTPAAAAVPSAAAGIAGVAALVALSALARARSEVPTPTVAAADPTASGTSAAPAPGEEGPAGRDPAIARGGVGSRRAFLGVTAAVAGAAAVAAVGGRALRSRFSAAESRAGVTLPRPARPLPAVPAGVEAGVGGIAPFVTPNRDFYRIDTALIVPQVRAEDWTLRVTGMVDEPFELTYAELSDLDIVEADITMTCVSNPVGGDLIGHARWLGVATRDLLDRARPRRGADQLVGRSTDGYTCGFPLAAAYDRPCLVAVGMNGEAAAVAPRLPGPPRHPGHLRLRRVDQVADRARGHDVRRLRPVLGATRLRRRGADQDHGPHRHAPQPRVRGGRAA